MKLLPATLASALLATLACSGCSTPTANQSNHWRIESIGPRITYTFFGYDGTKDGSACTTACARPRASARPCAAGS
ncbi:MAG: hypothetical protein IPK67_09570 [Planctomycetes bacterium]|nr:hypothetical protein [Planctomycetota bacterium]